MKLTAKKAVELSIELWTWLAETGCQKREWEKWKENGGQYDAWAHCFLCECAIPDGAIMADCHLCPIYTITKGYCNDEGSSFEKWDVSATKRDRKKYAKQFLKQLKAILQDMEAQ